MRKISFIFLSILLLIPLIPLDQAKANEQTIFRHFLEITADGSSDFPSDIRSLSNVKVTTMSMKKFVAMRSELDGVYDAIVIGEGPYNEGEVRNQNHDTKNIKNDITHLKAKEIISDFIEKGQPVFIDRNSFKNNGVLQQYFAQYEYRGLRNVMFYSNNSWFFLPLSNNILSFFRNYYDPKPTFELVTSPKDLGTGHKYKRNETINYKLNILYPTDVQKQNLKLRLYIDMNFDDQFDSSEVVKEQNVDSSSPTISYKLPLGFSGIRNWKVELLEVKQGGYTLTDFKKGTFLFQDRQIDIKVLQVMKNGVDSSLTNSQRMTQSFLSDSGMYKIDVIPTYFDTFNKSKRDLSNDNKKYSHESINGSYDMVIFGFADVYNNATLNANSVRSLQEYLKSEQSIMFTHDTIYGSNNVWVNNFMDATGQQAPQTNLGLNAPNRSTSTKKVNDGMMTRYPYLLDDNVQIASTHNQYYTLNLEDENVIPWYNIIGSNRDEYDSWNHYYTYSKGSVTYSGTGHTNSHFPIEEQKLFVNTMYRAFLGSNHAPVLTVLSPANNAEIPSNQKIALAYTLEDFDLQDQLLDTEVYVNGKLAYQENNVRNGKTINAMLDHGIAKSGEVDIKIVARDKSGAEIIKELTVYVYENENLLEVSRSLVPAKDLYKVEEEVIEIKYDIKPKDFDPIKSERFENELVIENMEFSETLPPNVEIVELPEGLTASGSLKEGYTITGTPITVTYKKNGEIYTADEEAFSIKVKAMESGTHILTNSAVSYSDFYDQSFESSFNTITIAAQRPIKSVDLSDTIIIDRGLTRNLEASGDFVIHPEDAAVQEIIWSEDSDNSIIKVSEDGVIQAVKSGTAILTVKVKDAFGTEIIKKSKVTVRVPIEAIQLENIEVYVGEEATIPITVTPTDATSSIEFTINNPDIATVNNGKTIHGKKAGETKLTAVGIKSDGTKVIAEAVVKVISKDIESITISPSEVYLMKNEIYKDFNITILPEAAKDQKLIWESADSTIVEVVKPGEIRAVRSGQTTIKVSAENSTVYQTVTVYVTTPLADAYFTEDVIDIEKGDQYDLSTLVKYTPADASDVTMAFSIEEAEDEAYINLSTSGVVEGVLLGEATVRVTVTGLDENRNKVDIIDTIKVRVVKQDSQNGDRESDVY